MELSKLYKCAQYYADLAEQAQRIADFGAQWQLGAQAAIATATPVIRDFQTTATMIASAFSSQVLESLRQAQKIRFEMIDISDHFINLQNMFRINLKQFLYEQTAYYQAWLDMQEEYDAFTQAFVFCVDKMFCIALRIVRNADDAKDVVQDAYEKAWKKLQTCSIDQIRSLKIEAWLSRIVKTTALNFLRDNGRCSHYEMDWMVQQPGSRFDQPEANLIQKELLQMVYDSFKTLPAIQHKVIFMRYVGTEASFQEIADYLERPIGTIKSDHRRGLLALRRQLTYRNFLAIDLEELVETLSSWPYTIAYSGHQGKECRE